jgi:hypothetical protein
MSLLGCHVIEEVGFGLTGMVWYGGSGFWLDWNGLE